MDEEGLDRIINAILPSLTLESFRNLTLSSPKIGKRLLFFAWALPAWESTVPLPRALLKHNYLTHFSICAKITEFQPNRDIIFPFPHQVLRIKPFVSGDSSLLVTPASFFVYNYRMGVFQPIDFLTAQELSKKTRIIRGVVASPNGTRTLFDTGTGHFYLKNGERISTNSRIISFLTKKRVILHENGVLSVRELYKANRFFSCLLDHKLLQKRVYVSQPVVWIADDNCIWCVDVEAAPVRFKTALGIHDRIVTASEWGCLVEIDDSFIFLRRTAQDLTLDFSVVHTCYSAAVGVAALLSDSDVYFVSATSDVVIGPQLPHLMYEKVVLLASGIVFAYTGSSVIVCYGDSLYVLEDYVYTAIHKISDCCCALETEDIIRFVSF
ncbi:hypothetical protein PCE1_001857 [Barthelona sp. PCE]